MQEQATDKESSVVQSAKRKSICPKEIVSKVYRAVFSTTVCWVSLPFDGLVMEVTLLVPRQCKKNNSQMYYCFDCGRFMCPDCCNAHEMLSESFEGHKATPVKDFEAEDYEALLKRQPFCSQQFHEKETTRFFCFSSCFVPSLCLPHLHSHGSPKSWHRFTRQSSSWGETQHRVGRWNDQRKDERAKWSDSTIRKNGFRVGKQCRNC